MILGFSRSVAFEPGSNRQGAIAPPSWVYLLPRLDSLRIVRVGNVDARLHAGLADWHDDSGETVLLLIGPASREQISTALAENAGAAVYAAADVAGVVAECLGTSEEWWLAPALSVVAGNLNDTAGAAPPANRAAGRAVLWVPSWTAGGGSRIGALSARALRVAGRIARRAGLGRRAAGKLAADDPSGVLLAPCDSRPAEHAPGQMFVPPSGCDVRHVPDWIGEIARSANIDLANATWRFVPSRGFWSQKILFLVTRPDGGTGIAVKITQDPKFNARLENEHHGLVSLAALDGPLAGTFPRPLFQGHHRLLAVVGEDAIDGVPFRARSDGSPACPHANAALDWLETVAAASAQPAPADELGEAVGALVERFLKMYAPGAAMERVLRADVEQLGLVSGASTVLTHGDPGPWNLLVTSEGRVAFLDWENAEPRGLPLWDLLYFLRTYGAFVAEQRSLRWTPKVFAEQFLEDSDLSPLLETRVDAHVRRLDLPRELVGALLRTNLAAYAAREAWSLDPRRLERGVSIRLLRILVERGDTSPVWRRLTQDA